MCVGLIKLELLGPIFKQTWTKGAAPTWPTLRMNSGWSFQSRKEAIVRGSPAVTERAKKRLFASPILWAFNLYSTSSTNSSEGEMSPLLSSMEIYYW